MLPGSTGPHNKGLEATLTLEETVLRAVWYENIMAHMEVMSASRKLTHLGGRVKLAPQVGQLFLHTHIVLPQALLYQSLQGQQKLAHDPFGQRHIKMLKRSLPRFFCG